MRQSRTVHEIMTRTAVIKTMHIMMKNSCSTVIQQKPTCTVSQTHFILAYLASCKTVKLTPSTDTVVCNTLYTIQTIQYNT